MDRSGYQFLPGAGFARDEDSRIGWSYPGDLAAKRADSLALAFDLRGALKAHYGIAQPAILAQQSGVFDSPHRGSENYFRYEWLRDEIESAAAHAFDGEFYGRKRGKEYYRK